MRLLPTLIFHITLNLGGKGFESRGVRFWSGCLFCKHQYFIGLVDCNHCNCKHKLFQNLYNSSLRITRFTKQHVVTVVVVTLCWSHEQFVQNYAGNTEVLPRGSEQEPDSKGHLPASQVNWAREMRDMYRGSPRKRFLDAWGGEDSPME